MTLKVVGAGLGRTGTHSLKIGLEQLLGGPCYHMVEVFPRPQHVPLWHQAILGGPADWNSLFEGFVATVDWPSAMAASEEHNADVRRTVPSELLVEWQPGDGWGSLCAGLGLPEPGEPFPHVNTTDDFRAMSGLADPQRPST